MDKNRLKKLCSSALDISYPEITVSEITVIPTYKYESSTGEWVSNSYSIFIIVKRNNSTVYYNEIENFIESILGFECCVDFS